MAPIPFRWDKDGVYNWPQYSRGSEKPAAHTQQKIAHVPPFQHILECYNFFTYNGSTFYPFLTP